MPEINKIKILFAGLIVLFIIVSSAYAINSQRKLNTAISTATEKASTSTSIAVSPTPMPFRELTIPYLRERTYQSSLNKLEQISRNDTYTSFLASYESDNSKINALLTEPTGNPPAGGWPAIVFIHGYIPPKQYATLERYTDYVDYLARNGFVVFKIDLRGHGESEGQASGAYYSNGYVIDALNAYAALQTSNFINPKRIGLWGHSMAGNIVLRSLVTQPTIPAAVIWAGAGYTYQDLIDYRIQDLSYVPQPSPTGDRLSPPISRQRIAEVVGPISDHSPFWQQFIPTHYLKDFKGAIQLNHAVDDDVVSIEYSRNLKKLLDKTTIPHELHEYPTGGHNLTGSSFSEAMSNTVEFFKQHLE